MTIYSIPNEQKDRLLRYYSRYGAEINNVCALLEIKLKQLCLAYTIQNHLPPEAMRIHTRIKSYDSAIKKLERKGWPTFYYPTDVISDLVGARIVCWFIDDCYGILEFIKSSSQLSIIENSIEDYIKNPKESGYRSIHILANLSYDSVKNDSGTIEIVNDKIVCEIQIRSKLQDAWGDITHEFHYKAKSAGIEDRTYDPFLSDVATRLKLEDDILTRFRAVYQNLADEKTKNGTRKGLDG